jgi:hypothetical protein
MASALKAARGFVEPRRPGAATRFTPPASMDPVQKCVTNEVVKQARYRVGLRISIFMPFGQMDFCFDPPPQKLESILVCVVDCTMV